MEESPCTVQVVKNYREILKTWQHKEKPGNESVTILKPIGPSFSCKTVKNSKISDDQINTNQQDPIDSIRKPKLSSPHKIMLGHLNVNSLRNKFESITDAIQRTSDIFSFIRN